MRGKNLARFLLIFIIAFGLSFVSFISSDYANASAEKSHSESWKLKYLISDKVLDAVAVKARKNYEIPTRYNGTDHCAREYIRLNLSFATWGIDIDGEIWIQSYKLGNGLVRMIWGPDSPHEELIGENYVPEKILTESDGSQQHYYFGDT